MTEELLRNIEELNIAVQFIDDEYAPDDRNPKCPNPDGLAIALRNILDALQAAEKRAEEVEELFWAEKAFVVDQKKQIDGLEAENARLREAEEKLHRANVENARLTNNNARLREAVKTAIEVIEDQICRCCGEPITAEPRCGLSDHEHAYDHIDGIRQALLPSGNKTPNPQEIDPNGKPSHEIDPSSAHYGSLNEWPS